MTTKLSLIKQMEQYTRLLPGAVSLAQGTPSIFSHNVIRRYVIKQILNNKVDKYSSPHGLLELRTLIAKKLLQKGIPYDPESEILVTAGGIEALSATLLSLLEPAHEVLVFTPSYPYYKKIIDMARGKMVAVPLKEKKGWKPDFHMLSQRITHRTKMIILCNPNNPTGSVFTKEELVRIGNIARKHNILIISDDIYENFYYGKGKIFNLCSQKKFRDYTIKITSLSKSFSLSGWRIGFLCAPKKYIERILPIHDNLINCAPVASQYAAIAALRHSNLIAPAINEYRKRRLLMGSRLEELKDFLDFIWPQGAYYFFPKIKGMKNVKKLCFDILQKSGVALVPGNEFGPGGENHIRLCFGRSREEIVRGMKRLKKYFYGTRNS